MAVLVTRILLFNFLRTKIIISVTFAFDCMFSSVITQLEIWPLI